MKSKLAIAILAASSIALSWACRFSVGFFGEILSEVAADRPIGSFPLLVYGRHSLLYLFPLPFLVWAALLLRTEVSPGDFHLFTAVILFVTVAFLGIFILGVVIPFTDTGPIIFTRSKLKPRRRTRRGAQGLSALSPH